MCRSGFSERESCSSGSSLIRTSTVFDNAFSAAVPGMFQRISISGLLQDRELSVGQKDTMDSMSYTQNSGCLQQLGYELTILTPMGWIDIYRRRCGNSYGEIPSTVFHKQLALPRFPCKSACRSPHLGCHLHSQPNRHGCRSCLCAFCGGGSAVSSDI